MSISLLKSSRLKVARAREQLQQLDLEFGRFIDSKPYTLRQEYEVETKRFVLIYTPTAPIPDDWAILIAEIFYNLRSALDNAIYELSVLEQGAPVKNSEFPIFNNKIEFHKTKGNGDPARGSGLFKIRGLAQKTRDLVEALQPYNVTGSNMIPSLLVLHEMNIRDKHREPFLCRGLADKSLLSGGKLPPNSNFTIDTWRTKLDEETILAWVTLPDGITCEVNMSADLAFELTFDESCCSAFDGQHSVIQTILDVANGVEKILNHLESSVAE